jgi:hypothetical protein
MASRRRTLTLVLLGLTLAFSTAASSAQAVPEFQAGAYPAFITGKQFKNHEFFVAPNTVVCKTVTYEGTITKEQHEKEPSTLSVLPKFEKCTVTKALVMYDATVEPIGCKFVFHLTSKVAGKSEWESHTDVVCPSEQEFEITIFNGFNVEHNVKNLKCTIKFPGQLKMGPNGTWRPELFLEKVAISKITVKGEAAFCGTATSGSYTAFSSFSAVDEKSKAISFGPTGE